VEKMALVISRIGAVSTLSEEGAGDETWNEGCIHIRQRAQSVIISVDFERLTEPAIAAAFYELADMRPQHICLIAGQNNIIEVLGEFQSALKRIYELLANADIRENGADMPSLPGGIGGCFEVKHQSGPEGTVNLCD
jgi:hypothetical protein